MGRWIAGNVLITVGLAWVAVHRLLLGVFPLSWGGPNIGGGFTVLLAYAAIVAGIIVVLVELTDIRAGRTVASHSRRRLPRTPAVLSGVAAIAAVAMIVAPPGPGGSGVVGTIGVTVDASGNPVLVLVVCERSVSTVRLSGPYRNGSNEVFADLTAPGAVTAVTKLPLDDLPAGWTGGPVDLPLDERPDDLVIASARGDESVLSLVSFTRDDLAALDPGRLLVNNHRTLPVDEAFALCASN